MVYANWRHQLEQLLWPARCVACTAVASEPATADFGPLDLCAACASSLPRNTPACLRCGLPLAEHSCAVLCGRCLRRAPLFQRTFCALKYQYPANHLIQRLKYGQSLPTARVLGTVLGRALSQHYAQQQLAWPQCIIPVPLHARRYRARGYNQVIEVGREVSKQLGVPLRTDLIIRQRDTSEQAGLTRVARRRNVRGAFVVAAATPLSHVAVLDDVITTGSTVSEITKVLRRAGVTQVDVWGIARAS